MATRKTPKKSARTGKKKTPRGSVFATLPAPIREAFCVAANEIFVENIEAAVEDAHGLLEEGGLGVTYQGFHRGLVTPKQLADALESLAPWVEVKILKGSFARVSPALTVGDFAGDLYDSILLSAAVDLAQGILLAAVGEPLPAPVQPFEKVIRHLADRLAQAIEEGDSSEQDLTDEILG